VCIYGVFSPAFDDGVAFGFVELTSPAVARLACWHEVVDGVCAIPIVFY
jgi:hypothetical protein